MSIYILKLREGKFWVGYTAEPILKARQFKDAGEWVQKYGIESIYSIIPARIYQLDHKVKDLMVQMRIENVRGGSWPEVHLPDAVRQTLQTELFGNDNENTCLMCGQPGHYMQDCSDDSGDSISEFFGPTNEPSPALRPMSPIPHYLIGPYSRSLAVSPLPSLVRIS
jgi:hypothetical protein